MLMGSQLEYEQAHRFRFDDVIPKPIQYASLLAPHNLGVTKHKIATAIEPQTKTLLGNRLGLGKPVEGVRRASMFPEIVPPAGFLGRAGFEDGPAIELAYAKQLLEYEQVTSARTLLERAVIRHPQDQRLRHLYHVIAPGRVVRREISYRDRRRETAWIQAHRTTYRGKWVALFGEQVLGIGDDLQTVLRHVREHHLNEPPLIHHFLD